MIVSLFRGNRKIAHFVICTVHGDINQSADCHIDPLLQDQWPFLLGLLRQRLPRDTEGKVRRSLPGADEWAFSQQNVINYTCSDLMNIYNVLDADKKRGK